MKRKSMCHVSLILCALICLSTALAQNYVQSTQVQCTSGGAASSSLYNLVAAIGQVSPIDTAKSAQDVIRSGFIYTLSYSSLSISHTPPAAEYNKDLAIEASIFPDADVTQAFLYYRKGGDASFSSKSMSRESGKYKAMIAAADITTRGLEYYFSANDPDGRITRFPTVKALSLPVAIPANTAVSSQAQISGKEQTAYRLISFPLKLDNQNAQTVMQALFGHYDRKKWRFFALNANQSYTELGASSVVQPGQAYWLIVKDAGKSLSSSAGKTIVSNETYKIALNKGFTFIGNPFTYKIPAANLKLKSSGASPLLRTYSGSWQAPAAIAMEPFAGYCIESNSPSSDTLYIDPYIQPTVLLAKEGGEEIAPDFIWSMRLEARCQDAVDMDNIIGVADLASANWDAMDYGEPPLIGEYVSLSFPHENWQKPIKAYSHDIRPRLKNGECWDFQVEANVDDRFELTLMQLQAVPQEFEIMLCDELTGNSQDMRSKGSYSLVSLGKNVPRKLQLLVGTKSYVQEQLQARQSDVKQFALLQNFPNPFNSATAIAFELPASSEVTVNISNAIGQIVAVLAREQTYAAGHHALLWDGKNQSGQQVASGTYFYGIKAGTWQSIKKMVLMH